jgi:hypothetical protein
MAAGSFSEEGSVDVLHHDIALSVRLAPPSLWGKGELRLRVRGPTRMVTLDAQELRITEVSGTSGMLPFRRTGDHVGIELPHVLATGAELTLQIAWTVPVTGKVPRFASDQVCAGYNTSAWMPTVQDPAQRATLSLHSHRSGRPENRGERTIRRAARRRRWAAPALLRARTSVAAVPLRICDWSIRPCRIDRGRPPVHAEGRDAPISLSPPDTAPRKPPRESELQARGVTYYRGALVLHRLRRELGETAFWAGIQRYVRERAGKSARTEDLRAALEAAGGRDLKAFFFKWVYSAAPDL